MWFLEEFNILEWIQLFSSPTIPDHLLNSDKLNDYFIQFLPSFSRSNSIIDRFLLSQPFTENKFHLSAINPCTTNTGSFWLVSDKIGIRLKNDYDIIFASVMIRNTEKDVKIIINLFVRIIQKIHLFHVYSYQVYERLIRDNLYLLLLFKMYILLLLFKIYILFKMRFYIINNK